MSKGKKFEFDQLFALREIERSRIKKGLPGYFDEIQAIINRDKDGAKALRSDDPLLIQIKVLWDKDWGTALGFSSFESYRDSVYELAGSIPERPPVEYLNKLVLVDRRPHLVDACRMAGLKHDGSNETFKPYDQKTAKKHGDVYWMWCQDGRRNRNKKPSVCRREFTALSSGVSREVGLDEFEFVSLYVQDPTVIGTKENSYYIDLPGAVRADGSDCIACGGNWCGEPKLCWSWHDSANPKSGSASRWEPSTQS